MENLGRLIIPDELPPEENQDRPSSSDPGDAHSQHAQSEQSELPMDIEIDSSSATSRQESGISNIHPSATTPTFRRPIMLDFCGQVSLPPRPTDINLNFCDNVSSTEKATVCLTGWQEAKVKPKNKGVQTSNANRALAFTDMNERQIKAFTGVSKNIIRFLTLQTADSIKKTSKLTCEQKIILLLIRLKLMVPFSALAAFFSVSESTAQKVFNESFNAIYDVAKNGLIWFDRGTIQARMPHAFRALYPHTRAIIDCSEIASERAGKIKQRVHLYSHYKSRFTLKFLVAIAPSGEIMFVSRTYGGRTTDTDITCNSGFLDLIEEGDVILGDKGFPVIEKNLNQQGGFLVMPPFKCGEKQFNEQQNQDGYKCASVRVHVERAIARLKLFECLNYVPIHMIPNIDKALVIVCCLTNLFNDLIKDE